MAQQGQQQMSYAQHLLDQYSAVADKMVAGKRSMKEMAALLQERANVENTLAKNLSKTASFETKYASSTQNDGQSTRDAWHALRAAGDTEAKSHQTFAAALTGPILDELMTAKNELSLACKRLFGEAEKVQKELSKAKDVVQKTQKAYHKAIKDAEGAVAAEAKAELTDAMAAQLDKCRAKARLLVKAVDDADRQYLDAVKGLKLTQTKHDETITHILNEFQNMDGKRIDTMKVIHAKVINAHNTMLTALQQNVLHTRNVVDSIDATADINAFIKATSSGSARPAPIEHEKVKSPVLDTYRTKMKQEHHYTRMTKEPTADDPRVVGKVLFAYQPSDQSELHMQVNDIVIIAKKDTCGWWLGEIQGRFGLFPSNYITMLGEDTRRTSIDSARPRSQILPHKAPTPPQPSPMDTYKDESVISHPRSGSEVTDATIYHMRSVSQSETVVPPPAQQAAQGYGVPPQAPPQAPSQAPPQAPPSQPQAPPPEPPRPPSAAFRKAQVEFNYIAQSDDELTIYQGEIVNIITEESGWCMGTNPRGETGVFPANYVKML